MSCSKCLDDFERRVLKRAEVPNSVVDRRALRCPQPWLNVRTIVLYAVNIGLWAASWWMWIWQPPRPSIPHLPASLAFAVASLFGITLARIAHDNAVRAHETDVEVARGFVQGQLIREEREEREEEERWRHERERAEMKAWEQNGGVTPHRRAHRPEPHEE